jgi:hypothetical protein
MRKQNIVIASVLVLIVPAFFLLRSAMPTTPAPKIAVSFAGFTNNVNGAYLAVFQVSNRRGPTIRISNEYHVEVRGDDELSDAQFFDRSALLAAGHTETYALPPYTNREAWRVAFYVLPDGWRKEVFDKVRSLPPSIHRLVPRSLKRIPWESARSDWIQ